MPFAWNPFTGDLDYYKAGGAGGATDLSYDASTRLLSSSTGTDVTLPLFGTTNGGLVSGSGGGTTNFLRADGSWAAPPAAAGTDLSYTASTRLLASSTGTDVTLPLFGTTDGGLVSGSGGGTTNFLRADGSWAAPPAGATNLGYTASTRVLTSDTGTDVTLPLVTATDPGLAPLSGGGTTNYLRADGTWAPPPGSGGAPSWYGVVYGAWANCDPQRVFDFATINGSVAATPTNIAITVARIAYFVPPANITVNRIRFFGVGATTNVYRVAVYNADTLARLMPETAFTTAANAWGAAGTSLALSLTAGQLYFIAVSVNVVGTTAGCLCMSPTQAATTGRVGILPKSFPGSLDIDSKHLTGAFAQFAVTAGALPATAPTIAVQAAWTGGFPAFWLDSNNA